MLTRRRFLQCASSAVLLGAMRGKSFAQSVTDPGVMWIQLMADGGFDQLLFCDPKLGLRDVLTSSGQISTAGTLKYCNLNPQVTALFQNHYQHMTVWNGVDTGTNNHEVGMRYCATGSSNTGYPTFAATVAAAYGKGKPLPLVDVSGYDETALLLAPTRISWENLDVLERFKTPNSHPGGGSGPSYMNPGRFMPERTRPFIAAAHAARTARLKQALKLPGTQNALTQLQDGRTATAQLGNLDIPNGSDELSIVELGLRAFKANLAVSLNVAVGGFDTHSGQGGDAAQLTRLGNLSQFTRDILALADAEGVPVAIVISSDFGRSPNYDGGGGTDHWPTASFVIVHNAAGAAKTGLPVDKVIGASTGGSVSQALQPMKIDRTTHVPDSAGIIVTPGHVYRKLRIAAGIHENDALARFPLSITSQDLVFA